MSDRLNGGVDHTSLANSAAESFGYFAAPSLDLIQHRRSTTADFQG